MAGICIGPRRTGVSSLPGGPQWALFLWLMTVRGMLAYVVWRLAEAGIL
jgi:hypothetical protein